MALQLYNTLTRKLEEFVPREDKKVGMYACGPTVYDYPHIGNWRTFVFADILRRVLEYGGYGVTQVMNATDVGHLTGDNLGNADLGEDRMEKAAKREGKTAWEIADYYINDFIAGRERLNILPPAYFVRATDHINEQIRLISRLIGKGLAYVTATGVFFDVLRFPDYGKLGGQKLIDKRVVTREELVDDKTKRNPADFALWKLSKPEDKRQMEWDSPWGRGFPGWHIECSAMAMKYLGESFDPFGKLRVNGEQCRTIDIHTGGVDHIAIHHTNEIAQSEGATGKLFVKYWLHGEFLTIDGGRMGKSLGNAYTLHNIIEKGFDPLALRYFYLSAHYRTVLNFTWEALKGAQNSLDRLRNKVGALQQPMQEVLLRRAVGCAEYEQKFLETINDDLNMPRALAVVWKMAEDKDLPAGAILTSLLRFDQVLGLELEEIRPIGHIGLMGQTGLLLEVQQLIKDREELRREKKFAEADQVRKEIEELGYKIEDSSGGAKIKKI